MDQQHEAEVEIEIPQYFVCPISLQIMKDPVITVTGITYDRESIDNWLLSSATCPVTKQPLPNTTDSLTPNHTLRRLIQGWCVSNATDRIPTPKSPISKALILKLLRDLRVPRLSLPTLSKILALAGDNDRNRKCMAEDGAICAAVCCFVVRCYEESRTDGLQDALRIIDLVWNPTAEIKSLINSSSDVVNSLTWILRQDHEMENHIALKNVALPVLKSITGVMIASRLELLDLDFFEMMVDLLRNRALLSKHGIKSTLQVLIDSSPWGRNRNKIIEAGAIFELLEMELENPGRNMTEQIVCVLSQLCSCADGRSEFLAHAGGIAVLAERILRVSPATDASALHILAAIAKYSGTKEVPQEMSRVGAVTKLCMVMQADCEEYVKNKAKEILRMHSNVWNNSPCVAVYQNVINRL